MAVRQEALGWERDAIVYKFPPIRAQRRARRQARIEVLRRRFALGAIGIILVGAGILATGPSGHGSAAPPARKAVTLEAGGTLWDIAAEHAPSGMDTRAYLDAILELNRIGVVVDPGTRIRLP